MLGLPWQTMMLGRESGNTDVEMSRAPQGSVRLRTGDPFGLEELEQMKQQANFALNLPVPMLRK